MDAETRDFIETSLKPLTDAVEKVERAINGNNGHPGLKVQVNDCSTKLDEVTKQPIKNKLTLRPNEGVLLSIT